MSSYHDSFTYNKKNSFTDMDLIISSFEPDDSFTETFLSMDPIFEENFDGTRDFSYGARYNSKAKINITVIKKDQSDFSMQEFRECAKWLTGARIDSWLDLYMGPNVDKDGKPLPENIIYSFLGKITDLQQMKIGGRVIGLQITFSSVAPWAFSVEQDYNCFFGQVLVVGNAMYDGVLYENMLYAGLYDSSVLYVDDYNVLYAGGGRTNYFSFLDEDMYHDGIIYVDNTTTVRIDNQTDDIYTYINLDTQFVNHDCDFISIKNLTLDEETKIVGMSYKETVILSSEQFISSDIPNKIFGDNFNFVWPRIAPGENVLAITGGGSANVKFTYRYPMKVADGIIDIGMSDICGYFNS